jgi:hypothetical protein
MFGRSKKGKITTASKRTRKKSSSYAASAMDLVLGIDFELSEDPSLNSVAIKLLKGKFEGVKYKYNYIGVEEDPRKTGKENLHMKMDYDVLDFNGHDKSIENDAEFNNTVFNVVYALIQLQQSASDENSSDAEDDKE